MPRTKLLASTVLYSSGLALCTNSISQVFTRFWTYSSKDPAGHTWQMKILSQSWMQEKIVLYIYTYLGPAFFEELVDDGVIGRSSVPLSGLELLWGQVGSVFVATCFWSCHVLMWSDMFWWRDAKGKHGYYIVVVWKNHFIVGWTWKIQVQSNWRSQFQIMSIHRTALERFCRHQYHDVISSDKAIVSAKIITTSSYQKYFSFHYLSITCVKYACNKIRHY